MDHNITRNPRNIILLYILTGILIAYGFEYFDALIFTTSILIFDIPIQYSTFISYTLNSLIILIIVILIFQAIRFKKIKALSFNNLTFKIIGFSVLLVAIGSTLISIFYGEIISTDINEDISKTGRYTSEFHAINTITNGIISIIKRILVMVLFFILAFKIEIKTAPNNGEHS